MYYIALITLPGGNTNQGKTPTGNTTRRKHRQGTGETPQGKTPRKKTRRGTGNPRARPIFQAIYFTASPAFVRRVDRKL